MAEIYTRKIKAITGNGTTSLRITPSPNKRLHSLQMELIAAGTNTLAVLLTALTEIRAKVGSLVLWRLNGTKLRDFMLLHGTTYDFNGTPNSPVGCQVTLPFAPEWLLANVADMLAWNPILLGGEITIEVDSTASLTCTAYESISDDLGAPSLGHLTLEVVKAVAAGTAFFVQKEIDLVGRLLIASIYPDSGGSNEITPASLFVGPNDVYAHEALTSAQNDEKLERFSLTPAASGRTANIYDIAFVKDDMLSRGIDLAAWGSAKIKVEAGSAMSGTCDILLWRLEPNALQPAKA